MQNTHPDEVLVPIMAGVFIGAFCLSTLPAAYWQIMAWLWSKRDPERSREYNRRLYHYFDF